MPFPVVATIAAGASLAGSGFNALSQGSINRRTMGWNERMYAQQRRDALTDTAFQNEYNSPAAQMQRLKAAGLNPNLVYGNGATTEGAAVRSSSVEGWKPQAPQIDTSGAVSSLFQAYDLDMKQTQIDVLNQSLKTSQAEAVLKAAQTAATLQGIKSSEVKTSTDEFNLQLLKRLETTTIEGAIANVNKTNSEIDQHRANTQFTLNSDERQAALAQNTLDKSAEEVLNLRAQRANTDAQRNAIHEQIALLKKDGILKDLDIALKRQGIQPHDALYQRNLANVLNNMPTWDKAGDIKKWNQFKTYVRDAIRNFTGQGRQ